ncbi:MAG TPA: hypothetical protein VFJ43_09820, partial [Bacteroidia bacterium]|nr:hypothetical protein [Bacteroidia bacterium]
DEKGHFVGWKKIFSHGPHTVISGILRLGFGIRPEKPWLPYSVIETLDHFLDKNSRVLEFGSGMSTLWYAKRIKEIFSIEHDFHWHKIVLKKIQKQGNTNVHLKFVQNKNKYVRFTRSSSNKFDLIIIDGKYRSDCVLNNASLIKPGGIIYLDNSDTNSSPAKGDMRKAEKALLTFAKKMRGKVNYFVDFAPGEFFVQEGMMVQLPGLLRK